MARPQIIPTTGETSYLHSLSGAELEAFTEGDCHLLAEEIHRRTHYPLIAIRLTGGNLDGTSWKHIAVQVPEGHILDVTGIHTIATTQNT